MSPHPLFRPDALADEVALVAGASGGLGSAVVDTLLALGARVVAADRDAGQSPAAASTASPNLHTVGLDVVSASSWAEAAAVTATRFGNPTILVNCAGIVRRGAVDEIDEQDFAEVAAVNERGCMLGMQALAPLMRAAGRGAVVNISSVLGIRAARGNAAYITSKWAIIGLSRAAALDLAPTIRVNTVLPGRVRTALSEQTWTPEAVNAVPLGTLPEPRDVADAVAFLVSPAARNITGTELTVDGGRTAQLAH